MQSDMRVCESIPSLRWAADPRRIAALLLLSVALWLRLVVAPCAACGSTTHLGPGIDSQTLSGIGRLTLVTETDGGTTGGSVGGRH